ncbi:MAG: aminotransferase class V-fold PLP-dependent enzyme, partial [Actinomycetota bacterium]|nr:aminotransferase class V-fold PLP-dependent enzyme [Actinomycetota bacterium]
EHFTRFLSGHDRLHLVAHSHHPWPDVSFEAHQQAWRDAARLMDDKWDEVFDVVVPEAQRHIAGRLGLSDPETVAFAPNTHELVVRVLSCLRPPIRILTTDAEFHSFSRQSRRLEEEGSAVVERVPAQPFESLPERLVAAVSAGGHDLVYLSHVHFDSAYVVPDLVGVVEAVPDEDTFVVIDGYHSFMAVPTDLSGIEDRAFFVGGGYKYAMAGEGCGFAHCPPGYGMRPVNTGWFAAFGELSGPPATAFGPRRPVPGGVEYAKGGARFSGGTFDPTGLYRFNAVQRWLDGLGLGVTDIHAHVGGLQAAVLDRVGDEGGMLAGAELLPPRGVDDRGHFLVFRLPQAVDVHRRLREAGVMTDYRGDRLRVGFGIYHDDVDVDELFRRLRELATGP